jgi:esterase
MIGGITPRKELNKCYTHTLFIKGNLSDHIPSDKTEDLKKTFPNAEVAIINEAGHWIHAEKPVEFLDLVFNFLLS